MQLRGALLLSCALLALSSPAFAKAGQVFEDGAMMQLPPDIYALLGDIARKNLKEAKTSETEFIGEETAEQMKDPLLDDAHRKRVIDRGMISVYSEWCGMDYKEQSYLPFMTHERAKKKWSDKQIAYIGVLHGVTMGLFKEKVSALGTCPDQLKQKLKTLILSEKTAQ